jgi:hypothetical protein
MTGLAISQLCGAECKPGVRCAMMPSTAGDGSMLAQGSNACYHHRTANDCQSMHYTHAAELIPTSDCALPHGASARKACVGIK